MKSTGDKLATVVGEEAVYDVLVTTGRLRDVVDIQTIKHLMEQDNSSGSSKPPKS